MKKDGRFYSFKRSNERGYDHELQNCIETT